ncbi:endonuclease/exonuclease/phosphatase family protein [Flavobacterium sp.]|jgi:endonuclease/exonuclease/phosphatase family metal-dependent hydrolase|uniref:endonuclease/exonuclease/phosphatase family protein n=1 Tax=Flavobacterium sp. TaxID=239 RepID=UPI0037BE2292
MTYNIRLDIASDGNNSWGNRKDFFVSQIKYCEPDILGIQEAKPNQVVDLTNALTNYDNVGIGREGIGKGESSNIFFNKDKFVVLKTNTFWLSETPDTISKGWDAAFNRVCTYVLLKDKKLKNKFWVFNTHLDHIGEVAKANSIKLIIAKIKELNSDKYPVIFMGDFNLLPTDDRIISLKNEMTDCRDVTEQKPFGPSGTFNNFKHDEPVTKLIDYIFISKDNRIKVKKYAILSDSIDLQYPSDHFPVFVKIKFEK